MYQVELLPQKLKQRHNVLGEIEAETDQFLLVVNGKHLGYVGKHPGAHISFVTDLPQSIQQEIAAQVATLKNEEQAPKTTAPVSDEQVNEALRAIANESDTDDDT